MPFHWKAKLTFAPFLYKLFSFQDVESWAQTLKFQLDPSSLYSKIRMHASFSSHFWPQVCFHSLESILCRLLKVWVQILIPSYTEWSFVFECQIFKIRALLTRLRFITKSKWWFFLSRLISVAFAFIQFPFASCKHPIWWVKILFFDDLLHRVVLFIVSHFKALDHKKKYLG